MLRAHKIMCWIAAALLAFMVWPTEAGLKSAASTVAASGATTNPIKIAVLGASESARSGNWDNPWPERLQDLLNQGGGKQAIVKNLAYHGASFFQANTVAFYGANTMVTEAILWGPDVVIVEFGGNDLMNVVDGRTLAQVKTDSDTMWSTLRAGLPNALIISVNMQAWDSTNFPTPGTTLKEKGVASEFMELNAAGVAAGFWSNEMLEVAATAGLKTKADNLKQLNTYIDANGTIGTNFITMDFWKLQRMGCTLPDEAHHNITCQELMAAWAYKQLKANAPFAALFPRLSTQIINDWNDPDSLFTYYLTASGDGWVRAAGADVPGLNGSDVNRFWGDQTLLSPEEWYLPWKTKVALSPQTLTVQNSGEIDGALQLIIRRGPPTQVVNLSIDGAAFFSSGESTDTKGDYSSYIRLGIFSLGNGAHTLRFKVGTEVYGPYTVTLVGVYGESQFASAANTTGFTATTAQVVGAREVVFKLTGALGAGANLTTPTAAQITAALPANFNSNNFTYRLRIINANAAAFAWTVVGGTGVTVQATGGGVLTIAANTWREFQVTVTAASTSVTMESIGTGTWS